MDTSLSLDAGTPAAAWALEHLDHDIVAWLTTVTPDGRPQASMVAFIRDGRHIIVYSRPAAPKAHNIAANPRVAFNLRGDEYGDHVLSIEGIATPDPSFPPLDRSAAYVAKYREPSAHWGMDLGPTARKYSLALRITPTRIRFA